ncbi:MAG: hypothetical protein BV456_05415, partial [Thermoplasmata archaeon M8B2D]
MVLGALDYFSAWWFFPVLVWIVIWKAIAMWRAARNNQMVWFIVCLVINTIGLLPMIYLAFFQKDRNLKRAVKKAVRRKKVSRRKK